MRELVSFFFQAEDGIRDLYVTGVQTCALPIYPRRGAEHHHRADEDVPDTHRVRFAHRGDRRHHPGGPAAGAAFRRSEERRVGKEWRSGRGPCPYKEEAILALAAILRTQWHAPC